MIRKRLLSACLALALCLSLLPVSALAVAPIGQVLYVGGVQISSTGYWTTDSDGNVTASTAGETPTDNYISYDAENNVLTLHNATIKNELELNASIEGGTFISGSAIGVFNKSGNAELTISLVGTNTIANVGKGIFVLASSASTGSSNLTIQGDGSLNASASQTGIWVQSNGNNAALCVENAEVTASPDGAVKNGVLVQAKDGSDVSLTVNGGSLTASVNANIRFQFGSGVYGSGTPTVTVSGNAVVDAKNGGIVNNSSSPIQYKTGSESTGGIVFDGNTGTVYGNVTLQKDLTIESGQTLTIPDGASLTIGNDATLTVDGGELTGENFPTEGVVYKVTEVKLDKDSLSLEVGGTATLTATITPDNATNKNVTWSSDDEDIATVDTDGNVTAVGAGTATITVTTADGSKTATCTVTVKHGNMVHTPKKDATCTAEGNKEYWTCGTCGKIFSDAEDKTEIALEDTVIPATGHTFRGGWCAVCGARDPNYVPPANPNYRVDVTATEGGAVTKDPAAAKAGETVTLTPTPDAGYEVGTVTVTDRFGDAVAVTENADGTYTFTMPSGQVKVEVTFVEATPEPLPFTDVNEDDWFHDAVQYAYENGLMDGVGDGQFAPNATTNRAMVVTILYRLAGEPAVSGDAAFTDVAPGLWYTDAVLWAAQKGIVNGISDTEFVPAGDLTREQLATILYRYAESMGYDVSAQADLSGFPDAGDIQSYATQALSWAVAEGLLQGFEDDSLQPGGTATRAQIATILMRFLAAAPTA